MTTMEDLTKTQIVLLALLVSFITSIATGIITTSLLAQAPQNVTQTIDRVVERVVTSPDGSSKVTEVIVVKEDDAIVSAVEKNERAIVRIKSPTGQDGLQSFYALGAVVSKTGLVISDKRPNMVEGAPYTIVFSDGSTLPAIIHKTSGVGNFVLFKIQAEAERLRSLTAVSLADSDPKVGQSVIAVQGRETNVISVGRILSVNPNTSTGLSDLEVTRETEGAPLLNLSGELVGLKTSNYDFSLTGGAYTLVSPLAKFVSENL